MLFTAGLPVFFLEIAIGQFAGVGPIKLFGRLAPALRGLGFVSKFNVLFECFRYFYICPSLVDLVPVIITF